MLFTFTCRAEFYVEAGQQGDALCDCNTALAMDKRCVAAYALRSKLDPVEILCEDTSSNENNADIIALEKTLKATEKAELLASAARDALAAFLIGGSSDLSYAAAAEEVARESCRIGARQIFEDRRSITGPNKAKEISEKGKDSDIEDSYPRAWLVQSFFAGYESYRTAFGLENMSPEDEIIDEEGDMSEAVKSHYNDYKEASEVKASQPQHSVNSGSSGCSGSGIDIDEEVKSSSSKLPLPVPPSHLTDGECSFDPVGYWILRSLVGKLEGTQEPGPEELAVLQASEEKKSAAGYVEILGSWVGEAEKMWADLCVEEESDNITDSESSTADQEEMAEERAGENDKVDKEYLSMLTRLGLLENEASDRIIGFKIGLKMGGRGSAQVPLTASDLSKELYVAVPHSSSSTDLLSDFDTQTKDSDLISHAAYTVCEGVAAKSPSSLPSSSQNTGKRATCSATPPSSPPCPAFKWCLQFLLLPEVSALTGVTFAPSGTVLEVKPLLSASPDEERALKESEKKEEEVENLRAKEEKNSSSKNFSWARQDEEAVKEDDDDGGWEDCDDDDEDDDETGGGGDDDEEWEDCDDEDEEEEEENVEEKEIADLTKSIRGVKMGWCAEDSKPKDKDKDKDKDKAKAKATPVPDPVVMESDPRSSVDCSKSSDSSVPSSVDTTVKIPVSVVQDPLPVTLSPLVQESCPSIVEVLDSTVTPVPAVAVTEEETEREPPLKTEIPLMSRSLHACLLSVCSSIAYLSGDALGAVKCLRASIQENITAGECTHPIIC